MAAVTFSRKDWLRDPGVAAGIDAVEALLEGVAGSRDAGRVVHAQLLSPLSKRLRPAVLLLAARCGGGTLPELAVRAGAAVEMLHEATLYHDDIVDEAPLRRGRPSVHASVGATRAALAGSELLYASVEFLAELPAPLRQSVGRVGERLCRGQLRELEMVGDLRVSVRERVRVMRDKTASLFELAAQVGGTLGGLGGEEVAGLRRFGRSFGLAYQLADDLRDLCGSQSDLGRAPLADLRDGVFTLPVLYALQGRGLSATVLRCALRPGAALRVAGRPRPDELRSVIVAAGGIRRAAEQLRAWLRAAVGGLPPASPDESAAGHLRRLCEGLLRHAGVAEVAGPVRAADSGVLKLSPRGVEHGAVV